MKLVKLFTPFLFSSTLLAMYSEQAYLYKDTKTMGMGGATIAVGGSSTSLFYNPAGLSSMEKKDDYIVDLFSLQGGVSKDINNFIDDLDEAMQSEDTNEVESTLQRYNGEHFHGDLSIYTALSKVNRNDAWSIGLFIAEDINLMGHIDGCINSSSCLESTSRKYGGIVTGYSKTLLTDYGRFDIGIGGKFILQHSYEGLIAVDKLATEDDFLIYLDKNYKKEAFGWGIDLGTIYHLSTENFWHPTIGISLLNIGNMKMDNNYGKQPSTLNIGCAIAPDIAYPYKLVVAFDYVDILNGNKLRLYNKTYGKYDGIGVTEYDEKDFTRRTRVGIKAEVIKQQGFDLWLSGGLYQGSYTFGLNTTYSIATLSFATYEENLGYDPVQYKDRRYSLQIGIEW